MQKIIYNLYNLEKVNKKVKEDYDLIINKIIKLILCEEKEEKNLISFTKIFLYNGKIDYNFNDNFCEIKKYFIKKISELKNNINNEKIKAIHSCVILSKEEKNDLKKNITTLFTPKENKSNDFEKTKQFIEEKIRFSRILKKTIENKNNYIDTEKIVKNYSNLKKEYNSKNPNFVLSLLSKCYEKTGTKIYIAKEKDKELNNIETASIQSLFSIGTKKKYEIHFDFGKEKNEKILNNKEEQEKFLIEYKKKLSEKLNIKSENLILTDVCQGAVKVSSYILEQAINENSLSKIKENECKDLHIKRIEQEPILNALEINEDILDPQGDRDIGWWGINETRGGNNYIPPLNGWIGIGLKVVDKYDNGNNDWLGYENKEGEFSIAYLGIYSLNNDKEQIIRNLNDFCQNINLTEKNSLFYNNNFPSGEGICVFQNPDFAENSAGYVDILGFRLKILLMCRVNPKKIRRLNNIWIVNPTPDEIRPYRILIKKIAISPLASQTITTSIKPIDYILDSINSNDLSFYNLPNVKSKYYTDAKQRYPENKNKFVINLYTSQENIIINNYLRTKAIETYSESEIKSWICCLQNALKSMRNNVGNETVVYRGINLKFPKEIGIGSRFFFREFVSTSLNRQVVEAYADKGTILVIKIKNNGNNGHQNYCLNITQFSKYKDEEEILISSHCYYTITNIVHNNGLDIVYMNCEGYKFN